MGGGSPTHAMTPHSATSSKPPPTPALGDHEVTEFVRDTLDQVYALCLETLQEMGFICEVDRALAKSIMSEFIRLQLIVGDDLNDMISFIVIAIVSHALPGTNIHWLNPCI